MRLVTAVVVLVSSFAVGCGGATNFECTTETTEDGCDKPGCAWVTTPARGAACREICRKNSCLEGGTCREHTPVASTQPTRVVDYPVCLTADDETAASQ